MNMINRKLLYANQISSRWKKVNKMRHFTVIADLNVAPSVVTYLFFCLFYSSLCQLYNGQKQCFCNGICNFSNIYFIKNYHFECKTLKT